MPGLPERGGPQAGLGTGAGVPPVSSDDGCGYVVGNALRMEYVSRAPQPPLDDLIHDIYYLGGEPPYRRLTLPAAPAPLLIVNLGAPFHIRAGNHIQAGDYADGCAVSTPTRPGKVQLPDPEPVRRRAPQAVGAGSVPADGRGRAA